MCIRHDLEMPWHATRIAYAARRCCRPPVASSSAGFTNGMWAESQGRSHGIMQQRALTKQLMACLAPTRHAPRLHTMHTTMHSCQHLFTLAPTLQPQSNMTGEPWRKRVSHKSTPHPKKVLRPSCTPDRHSTSPKQELRHRTPTQEMACQTISLINN